MICVYPSDCTDFTTNGSGAIDPSSATVTETLNGEYELTVVHPIDGSGKWQRLDEGCILRAPVPAAMTPRLQFVTTDKVVYRGNLIKENGHVGLLRLYNGPGRSYRRINAYIHGSLVEVVSRDNAQWYEVAAPDGKRGYMEAAYLIPEPTVLPDQVVEPRQLRDQLFRIYRIVPELNQITVYARHIFYDLLDNMIQSCKPLSSMTGASVVQALSAACLSEHSFSFYSDLTATAEDT